MDWKVGIHVEGKQWVQLATVRDVVGAAIIAAELYSVSRKKARVSEENVRATLRTAFEEWGLPEEIQTDGEPSLIPSTPGSFPSMFSLWLIGLGVRHHRIRPGIATDDAEVERTHRTLSDYVLVGQKHQPVAVLQSALRQARYELNAEYPSRAHGCGGRPPLLAHPELLHSQRRYTRQKEADCFDLRRVDAYLSTLVWERRVGKTGQITLSGSHETYSVGRQYYRQIVQIQFDPQDRCFVAFLPDETNQACELKEIKRWPAKNLGSGNIMKLPIQLMAGEMIKV